MFNDFNQKGHPMVFKDEATNTNELKEKCRAAIASLTRQHGLAERLAESCFMIALSELENSWKQRAEAAEAASAKWKEQAIKAHEESELAMGKVAKLEKQEPRYQIQKKTSYGRESVWIDVASREEAETNVLHGYRWRIVYDAPAIATDLVPEGWKLVPVEPTEEMVISGFESQPDECLSDPAIWEKYSQMSGCQQASYEAQLCWAAMLTAAPGYSTK